MTTHITDSHASIATGSVLPMSEVDEELVRYETYRARQLEGLAPDVTDPVALAHRETVARILGEIRLARRRLEEGLYGLCVQCGARIAPARLELRPWTTTCVRCARRA